MAGFATGDANNGCMMLRAMQHCDIDAVVGLLECMRPTVWSTRVVSGCFGEAYRNFVMQAEDGRISALVITRVVADVCEILGIAIEVSQQRQGIGRQLMLHVLQTAPVTVDTFWLEVRESNTIAIAFYKALGFRRQSIRKNYYPCEKRQRENAWVMCRSADNFPA